MSQYGAEAVPPPTWKQLTVPSALLGQYCGGEPQDARGLSLDLNAECRRLYPSSTGAAAIRQDAYGWVCKIPKQPDKGLNMQAACQRTYGTNSIATLVGIGANDWRCLRPADVSGHVVPVLLFPVEKLNISEAPFVTAALGRLNNLMGGIRRFYRERTFAALGAPTAVRGTNAFVLPTSTTAKGWQDLAVCTDQNACSSRGNPAPFDRYGFHNRVNSELANGRWNVLVGNSSVRIGGFVTLGSSFAETPTWLGAAAGGAYFSQPPSNSYAQCGATANNPPAYENAFYAAGHEFGHTMGLPHTDEYPYNNLLLRPSNYSQSIMYTGNGTQSALFPFEAYRLLQFLNTWQ
jgi:hypothetical protein